MTHWIGLHVNCDNIKYLESFRVEYISKEIKKFIINNDITTNTYRIQENVSIICGYFCIRFADFMLKGKSFLSYTKLFSPKEYEKNDVIILKYLQWLKTEKSF